MMEKNPFPFPFTDYGFQHAIGIIQIFLKPKLKGVGIIHWHHKDVLSWQMWPVRLSD